MNIVILGPGAVGSLWASHFKQAGHKVSVWSNSDSETLSFQLDQHPPQIYPNRNSRCVEQADLLLVTVKAWQVLKALRPLERYLSRETIVVLMHNGMGTAESVSGQLPLNPIVLATTTHGAYKQNADQVLHTGLGETQLGGYNQLGKQCGFLEQVFDHALAPVKWHGTIQHALWIKLAINCAINPLTAIHQITNGQLAGDNYQIELQPIIEEVAQVLSAEQGPISHHQLLKTIHKVIENTATNHSSMQQDIYHKRPTEIDFITGYLLQRATQHHISAPKNRELYQKVKRIEQSWNLK